MLEQTLMEHYATVPDDPAAEARIRTAVLGESPRRRPVLLAVAASIVVVALVAAGVLWLERSHPTGHQRAAADPLAPLYRVTWVDQAAATMVIFAPGVIQLSDGCSGDTSSLVERDGRLRIGGSIGSGGFTCSGTTVAAGSPAEAQEERESAAFEKFDRVLKRGASWTVRGSVLTLSARGETVRLDQAGTVRGTFQGSRWALRSYDAGQGPRTTDTQQWLAFDRNNQFVATDDCVAITGTIHVAVGTIDFARATLTGSCSWPDGSAGPTVRSVLTRTVNFRAVGDSLVLTVPGTKLRLVYAAT